MSALPIRSWTVSDMSGVESPAHAQMGFDNTDLKHRLQSRPTMTQNVKTYAYIDALRGLAILAVLLRHSVSIVAPTSDLFHLLTQGGGRGVQLFYVVSALTLCLSWQSRRGTEASQVRNYFVRRFFRIAPMFYLAIAFYLVLNGTLPREWAPNGIPWWYVPLTALFLHGVLPETVMAIVPGGWSMAVEVGFYVALPMVLTRVRSLKSGLALLGLSVVAYCVNRVLLEAALPGIYPANQQYLVSGYIYFSFFGQLPVFVLGVLAYFIIKERSLHRRAIALGSLALPILLVALIMLSRPTAIEIISNPMTVGAIFTLVVLALAYLPDRHVITRVVANPVLVSLGKLSYSMYLTHSAVLGLASTSGIAALFGSGDLSSAVYFLCVVAVTAAVSVVFYQCVERPGVRLGNAVVVRLELAVARLNARS